MSALLGHAARPLLRFYALVTACAVTDLAVLIGLIWAALRASHSSVLLGGVLAMSALLPFGLRTLWPRLNGAGLSMRQVLLFRALCFAVLLGMAWANRFNDLSGFILAAAVVGVLNYSTVSAYEAFNTQFVLAGAIDSQGGAKWMQTAAQLGSFSGAFLGGLLLENTSMTSLICVAGVMALGTSALALWAQVGPAPQGSTQSATATFKSGEGESTDICAKPLYWLCVTLGMIGFHIGAFNTLTPVIYQQLNGWTSADFGLASGVAGIGAFSAALLPVPKISPIAVAVSVVFADVLLAFAPWQWLSIGICCLVGFGINQIRIQVRKSMIELARDAREAERIAALSALFFIFFQALGPLLLGLAVSNYGWGSASARPWFAVVGLALWLTVTGAFYFQRHRLRNAHG